MQQLCDRFKTERNSMAVPRPSEAQLSTKTAYTQGINIK